MFWQLFLTHFFYVVSLVVRNISVLPLPLAPLGKDTGHCIVCGLSSIVLHAPLSSNIQIQILIQIQIQIYIQIQLFYVLCILILSQSVLPQDLTIRANFEKGNWGSWKEVWVAKTNLNQTILFGSCPPILSFMASFISPLRSNRLLSVPF